ncbi:hypothetical protein Bbelb_107600 [Branchiostoma belcheri]|nr:hypothetical protein Bbelb_107600 [Branchiostoma belcheri]
MDTKLIVVVFLATLPCLCLTDLSTAPITTTWIPKISRKMVKFAESQTGALQLVKAYDEKLNFTEIQIDGETQLHLLTQAAGDRLKKCREILHRNKAEIEASHAQGPAGGASASDCCDNLGQLEYDPRFLQQIVNDSCATFTDATKIRPNVYDTMKSNIHEMSGATWQYYGAKEGEYHQFPKNDRSCEGNDHRFRNWYVSAASPKKKNVVIVMDVSGSMREPPGPEENNRLNLAKQAALTVLDTLTPRDWGGVVSFSARAEAPEGCLGDSLGEANPTNIGIMQDFINQRVPETITVYAAGFQKAFDMFLEAKNKKPEQFEDCYNIIIFLTDGQPTDTYFSLDQIAKGQNLMDRSVHIFTYGLGLALQSASSGWAPDPNIPWVKVPALDFLATIADQNNHQIPGAVEWTNGYCENQLHGSCFSANRDPQGVGPWGRTEYIDDNQGDKLKTIMGSYYDFFPFSSDPEPTYSVPTNDEHLGLVINAALPTIDTADTFFGVTAVDISMEVVFHEIASFDIGQYSYAFLVDREDGRVLIHRNLPKPMEWRSEPTFLGLEAMESALRSREINKILNGDTGDYWTDDVKVPIARGNAQFDGAVTIEKAATFYYEPIPDTKYSVVLCLFEDDETIAIPNQVNPENGTDALYHRLDLLYMNNATGDTQFCRLYDEYATPDESTIKAWLYNMNKCLIEGIRTDVILSAEIEQYWRENGTESVWRYFGTENGVFRIFPGIITDKRYDPTRQTWYARALSRPEDYTFSRPVPSPFGGGNMVTISRVIYHTETEERLGVIAADITETYYYSMLYTEIPECLSDEYDCFLLDDSGYFMESLDNTTIYYLSTFDNNTQNMEHDHLTHRFPWLAKYLIVHGEYLRREWCNNYATQNSQMFYDTTGFVGLEVTTGQPCYQFALHPINATNTFILTLHNRQTYNCDDRPIVVGGNQCPCVCDWNYESCTNEILRLLSDIPCPPPPEDLTARGPGPPYPPEPEVEDCEEKCSAQSDNITCEALPHCVWCEELDFPVCTEICLTREKFPVSVFFPCVNLTELSRDEQEELKENFYLKVIQLLPNVTQQAINFPENVTENTIEFTLQGEMSSPPPDESIALLRQQTNWRQNFTVGPHRDPAMFRSADPEDYTDLKMTLFFDNVNFTAMLSNNPTSDTRRNIVDQITELVNNTLSPEVSVTMDNVWMEQNYIPFTIYKLPDSAVLLMDEFRKLEEKVRNADPQTIVTAEGTNYSPVNISEEGSFYQLCPQSCDLGLSKEDCDDIPSCNWEDFIPPHSCSSNSYLVESIPLTAYFPCDDLTLLSQWEQDQVINNFKAKVLNRFPGLSDKAIHSVQITKDPNFIGSQISFILQATMSDPYITDTYNTLKDAFNKANHFTVGPNHNPSMYVAHGTAQNALDYTDLRIVLKFPPGTDFDAVLQASPLTARDVITSHITTLANRIFRTEVAATVSDMWLEEDIIPLMIHKDPNSPVSLQQEADKLEPEVVAGRVQVTVDGQTYTAVSVDTEGSFESICPRPCIDGTDEADCVQIPGCDWGDFDNPQVCSDNSLLAESIVVETLFPCADFGSLSPAEQLQLFTDFKRKLHLMLPGIPQKAIDINSFKIVDDDTITFALQGTMQYATLHQYYTTIRQELEWAENFRIGTTANPNNYRSRGLDDYTNLRVQLIFNSTLNLDPMLANDLTLRETIRTQTRNNLVTAGVLPTVLATLGDMWMERNIIPFTISKAADDVTSLLDEATKVDNLITANSVIFPINGVTWRPVDMLVNGSFDVLCPQQCQDGTDRGSCTLIPGCDWADYDDPVTCLDDAYLVEHINMSAFFPCLFVPVHLNSSAQMQQEVADSFLAALRAALQKRGFTVPDKVIHAVQVGRDTIDFRIQSTMEYQNLTDLQSAIRDILSWDEQFTFDGYRSANPDDEFNNTVKFEISFEDQNGMDVDFDTVLESNFTIRDILELDIINFVSTSLGPSSVATLNVENIWIQSNYCTFSISVPLDDVQALAGEAIKLVNNIGNFVIHAGGFQVQAVTYKETETCDFCPPVCELSRDEQACGANIGCQWCVFEGSPYCGSDCLLQEETQEELSAYFPCLPEVLDDQAEQGILDSFREEVRRVLSANFGGFNTSRNLLNVTITNRTISFSLKSSMKQTITPEMISFLRNFSNWAGVTISHGGNRYPAWDPTDYTDIKFFLRFDSAYDFTAMLSNSLDQRRNLEDAVVAMVGRSSSLPLELKPTVANIWAEEHVIPFTVNKDPARKDITMADIAEAFTKETVCVDISGTCVRPLEISYELGFYSICQHNCSTIPSEDECVAVPSCGWCTLNEGPGCGDNCYLVEWAEHFAFIPCNQTRDLSHVQRQQLVARFRLELAAIMGSTTDKIIRNVTITDSGIYFELQGTMQDRFLPEFEIKIRDAFELAANFTVGDAINPDLFRTRNPEDFTEMVITMEFNGVDFANLVSQHSVPVRDLHPALKAALTSAGISQQYVVSSRILHGGQGYIEFSITKDSNSQANLTVEVEMKLQAAQNRGGIPLNLKPGWPGPSVSVRTTGTFDCLSLNALPTTTAPPTTYTTASNNGISSGGQNTASTLTTTTLKPGGQGPGSINNNGGGIIPPGQGVSGFLPEGCCVCPANGSVESIPLTYDPEAATGQLSSTDKVGMGVGIPVALAALAGLGALLMFFLKRKTDRPPTPIRKNVVSPVVESFETNIYSRKTDRPPTPIRKNVVSPVVESFETNIYSVASMDDELSYQFGKKGAELHRFRDPNAVYGRLSTASWSPYPSTASSSSTMESSLSTPDVY